MCANNVYVLWYRVCIEKRIEFCEREKLSIVTAQLMHLIHIM